MMKKCPHCGSEDGYTFTIITRHSRIGTFGYMEEETTEETFLSESKTAQCTVCRKRISLNDIRASGDE